jgi:MFS family permease
MVEKREDLGNAIALNSTMVNAARLLGPSLGGVLIAAVGEGWCFFADAVSYLAVIASLLLMRLAPRPHRVPGRARVLPELREGWAYVAGSPPIRSILLLLALVSLVGMPYTVLMPVFASEVLHGGPHTLGCRLGAVGVGALLGAVFLANRRTVVGLGKVLPLAAGLFGAGLIGFSLSRVLWVSLFLLLLTGIGFMVNMAASNTLLQTLVEDSKRGRVMSFYTMAIVGITPFGSLLAGGLAHRIGTPHTLFLGGVGCIAGALWFVTLLPRLRERVRPVYVQMGLLPELVET